MFTGIVEGIGEVLLVEREKSNCHFALKCPFTSELKVDQSLSHNGVCLTVTKIEGDQYWVTAIDETLKRTNLGELKPGNLVNLERCMPANGRFDGHIVQGHVDQIATCTKITEADGSWVIGFEFDFSTGNFTVSKGSICINGVSLTVVDSYKGHFSVAIIPYTWDNTNFNELKIGSTVNLEFDVIGKYVRQLMSSYGTNA